jgi:hypothetical protein
MVDTNVNDADASKEVSSESTKQDETINKNESSDAEKQLKELQEKLAKTEEILAKARRGEKDNQSRRKELETELAALKNDDEAGDLKTKYEATVNELNEVRSALQNTRIDAVLKEELTKANVKALPTALKVVDRSKITLDDKGEVDTKSIASVIEELKKTDSVLFQEVQTPALKRTGETTPIASFKTEMAMAKNPSDVQKILAKYGMGMN